MDTPRTEAPRADTARIHASPTFEHQFTHPRGRWISARDGRYLKPRNSWTDRNVALAQERAL